MITMFDRDNSRTINVNEFCELWKYLGDWRKTFDRFDVDRSGNITKDELQQALTTMGYTFSPQFPNLVMQKFDYRRSGTLQVINDFLLVDLFGVILVCYKKYLVV